MEFVDPPCHSVVFSIPVLTGRPNTSDAFRAVPDRPGTGPRLFAGEYTQSNKFGSTPSILFVLREKKTREMATHEHNSHAFTT